MKETHSGRIDRKTKQESKERKGDKYSRVRIRRTSRQTGERDRERENRREGFRERDTERERQRYKNKKERDICKDRHRQKNSMSARVKHCSLSLLLVTCIKAIPDGMKEKKRKKKIRR
jgi:hypothetical protein